jgi:hypothetical protein
MGAEGWEQRRDALKENRERRAKQELGKNSLTDGVDLQPRKRCGAKRRTRTIARRKVRTRRDAESCPSAAQL